MMEAVSAPVIRREDKLDAAERITNVARFKKNNWATAERYLSQGPSLKSHQGEMRINYRGRQCAESASGGGLQKSSAAVRQ